MLILLDVSEFQSVGQLDRLLKSADDEIVGVYIKGTQGESYRDSMATAFAQCAEKHNTPFGYYDFLMNDQANVQAEYFKGFESRVPASKLKPMLDCEGDYNKYSAGVQHWDAAYGSTSLVYAQLSNMTQYSGINNPKWVAQYDQNNYYRPSDGEIQAYKSQGYVLWQFTSNYQGLGQDASVLLADSLEAIKR